MMNMGFFIGTADRRELEFEHGAHSSLVMGATTRVANLLRGGSPDGVRNTGPNETGQPKGCPA